MSLLSIINVDRVVETYAVDIDEHLTEAIFVIDSFTATSHLILY